MIYAFGGGGFGGIVKAIGGVARGLGVMGPEEAKIPDSGESAAEERRNAAEAERRERLRNAKRAGRQTSLLTGGGSTAGVQTSANKTVLGSTR